MGCNHRTTQRTKKAQRRSISLFSSFLHDNVVVRRQARLDPSLPLSATVFDTHISHPATPSPAFFPLLFLDLQPQSHRNVHHIPRPMSRLPHLVLKPPAPLRLPAPPFLPAPARRSQGLHGSPESPQLHQTHKMVRRVHSPDAKILRNPGLSSRGETEA